MQIGTPLTHERFLRRSKGAYGPRVEAGKHTLPGHKTPMKNLYLTGDFTFVSFSYLCLFQILFRYSYFSLLTSFIIVLSTFLSCHYHN